MPPPAPTPEPPPRTPTYDTETEIADLAADLAGQDPPGEDYLAKLRRLTAARSQARELILTERTPPAADLDPPQAGATRWTPVVDNPLTPGE